MIASAMFFGAEGDQPRPIGLKIGQLRFTLPQIFIAIVSLLIVAPINIIIITLFKKAKPKESEFKHSLDATKGLDEESRTGDTDYLVANDSKEKLHKDDVQNDSELNTSSDEKEDSISMLKEAALAEDKEMQKNQSQESKHESQTTKDKLLQRLKGKRVSSYLST